MSEPEPVVEQVDKSLLVVDVELGHPLWLSWHGHSDSRRLVALKPRRVEPFAVTVCWRRAWRPMGVTRARAQIVVCQPSTDADHHKTPFRSGSFERCVPVHAWKSVVSAAAC